MLASELIAKLEKLKAEHGDKEVWATGNSTGADVGNVTGVNAEYPWKENSPFEPDYEAGPVAFFIEA